MQVLQRHEIVVRKALPEDRLPLFRMLELYQYDLSAIWDQDLDSHGEYGYYLDNYWNVEGFHAYVATVQNKFAGFALFSPRVRIGKEGYWIDQFFVMKKYRRAGVGELMAKEVLVELPGRWEVGQMPENYPAQDFWRKVISEVTGARYKEQQLMGGWWQGFVQIFETAARR